MEFKIGDKVRFLNEKGDGVVTRILGNNMVNVAIEEGFELPVMASDLIKIEPKGMASRFFDRSSRAETPQEITERPNLLSPVADALPNQFENAEYDRVTPLYRQTGSQNTEGIYIVYVPQDQKILLTGKVNIFLINNSKNQILYSLLLNDTNDTWSGVDYDVIPPYSKIILETIERDDLERWSEGIVQVLFHSDESTHVLAPLHSVFKVKPVRFYKETNYQFFGLTGQKALVVMLGDIAGQMIVKNEASLKGLDPAVKQKISSIAPPAYIDNFKTGFREAEVDLHISALKEDYSTMNNSEILQYQVDYFTRMFDSALSNNYHKVVFIHGIGNGSLKSAILSAISDYENLEIRAASFAKYGNGAVEVIIHRNS
ncbi:MAG: DUF2027 domain-containing protein [Lentimicrobium sp.]|nr:DUF2027 domain-containing protein [Lentimicrobium sp.]